MVTQWRTTISMIQGVAVGYHVCGGEKGHLILKDLYTLYHYMYMYINIEWDNHSS